MNLNDYGFMPNMLPENADGVPARVSAVHRERYAVICEYGEVYARLKTKEYYVDREVFPTVGDYVMINYIPNADSQIISTLPRKTLFSRNTVGRDKSGYTNKESGQVVAANFDYVFILQSLNHDFNTKRLERYLTLAWSSGAVPVIILTKADLENQYENYIREAEKVAVGVGVYVVSSKTGYGLDKLGDYLKPRKTIVFLGSSGVGKSSLVNALAGEEIMSVNYIREDDSRGRHTTTHRQLIMLKSGVMVIDTPGMRELGMWDATGGIMEAFSDVEQYLGKCRFSDCRHQSEPGCALKAAIECGELSSERWESYCNLKNEAAYSDDKAAYLRKKEQWHKDITKINKQREAINKKFGNNKP